MYEKFHSNRNNLLIHLIAVPSFIAGALLIVYGLFTLNWLSPFVGGALALLSVAAQGQGHKLEEHPAEPFKGPGDFIMDQIGRIRRRRLGEVAPFVFSGVQILSPRLFDGLKREPFSLNRIYDRALEDGRLCGLRHDGLWFHVGSLQDLERVERELGPQGLGLAGGNGALDHPAP